VRRRSGNSLEKACAKEVEAMKNFLLPILMIGLLTTALMAQQPAGNKTKASQTAAQAPSKERRGSIKGRVVNDNGRALANISVMVYSVNGTQPQRRVLGTDGDGRFEADDLSPAVYTIQLNAPSYVLPVNPSDGRYYRIGDDLTFTMIRGGVITGTVRNSAGEPVVGVMVSALRVRDAEGKPSTRTTVPPRDRMTDDRGIYRVYGLEPGAYLIVAGGRSNYYAGDLYKYNEDVRTYHPSSSRETAAEVMVQTGQEISGIDINYRGGKGQRISGTIAGGNLLLENATISVWLINAASGLPETSVGVQAREAKNGFTINGVTDGDYLIRAELMSSNSGKERYASPSRRVLVKGGDVSGIELALAPLASISGAVMLEQAAVASSRVQCENRRQATIEETILTLRKDTKGEGPEQKWLGTGSQPIVGEKNEFTFNRLVAGTYHLSMNLPSDAWYLKGLAPKGAPLNSRNQPLNELAAKGLAVKAGEHISGLKILLAEGAASVSGFVKAASEGLALPPRLRVYLMPAEGEQAGEALRFFQAEVQFDGAFRFTNLPPGKYRLLARAGSEENLSEQLPRPIYWDAEGRALLVKAAAAEGAMLELPPCKKISNFVLRQGSASPPVAPAIKK
jgi:hypothetical protein